MSKPYWNSRTGLQATPARLVDIATVVSFLANADAYSITGQTITVDGGQLFS
ncbi:hypothetical protein B0H11DRAFT_2217370 [Mycena galericulata]|nr:hypothetical protein B0H11DRAFT_2217370 [Mycena galericulata]